MTNFESLFEIKFPFSFLCRSTYQFKMHYNYVQLKIIFSFLALLFIISVPSAFADVTITPVTGSGVPGCEAGSGCFSPMSPTITIGETVIFSNTDSAAHTFTAGSEDGLTGEFDSSMVMAGGSYAWTADAEGFIPYFCIVHPWMYGQIFVEASVPTVTSTVLILDSFPSSIELYDSISVSGVLIAIDGTPISGKPVWIEAESSSGWYNSVETTTNSNGYFESVLSFSHDDGSWIVYAGFDGDSDFIFSYSGDHSLFVEQPVATTTATIITLNSIPSSIELHDSISVSGVLIAIDGTPISGKPVWN